MKPGSGGRFQISWRGAVLLASIVSAAFFAMPAAAQDVIPPRLQIGIGLLPAVIAANKQISSESADPLPVYLVYQNNRLLAERLKPGLEKVERIKQRKLEIKSISLDDLLASKPGAAGAIFLAEELDGDLESLIEFVEKQKILLFSPFKGNVERGVAAGFRVTDKVLPMVNMNALKKSNIQLKAFFLRVAVKHE